MFIYKILILFFLSTPWGVLVTAPLLVSQNAVIACLCKMANCRLQARVHLHTHTQYTLGRLEPIECVHNSLSTPEAPSFGVLSLCAVAQL